MFWEYKIRCFEPFLNCRKSSTTLFHSLFPSRNVCRKLLPYRVSRRCDHRDKVLPVLRERTLVVVNCATLIVGEGEGAIKSVNNFAWYSRSTQYSSPLDMPSSVINASEGRNML